MAGDEESGQVARGGPRVVLVHEWLTNLAGSEKVVAELRQAFPGSPIVTSVAFGEPFCHWDLQTSFLQRFARGPSCHIRLLPAMPLAFRSVKVPDADVVITSFHSFALHARVPRTARHIVYCHTPPRFLWASSQFGSPDGSRRRALAHFAGAPLRRNDRRHASRAQQFIANSHAVATRIRRSYGIEAPVIHPPVDVERFKAARTNEREDYFLVVSRLVPYKRVDLVVEAFARLGWPLIVAGEGRARVELERRGGPSVRFIGRVADEDIPSLMARARGFVMGGEEDFGITPVEAMAAGTPVIAFGRGGALETVEAGKTGAFFSELTSDALCQKVKAAAAADWDHDYISRSADRFGRDRFRSEIRTAVRDLVERSVLRSRLDPSLDARRARPGRGTLVDALG